MMEPAQLASLLSGCCEADDASARRRDQLDIDAVVFGQRAVAVRFDHLQVIHAPDQRRRQNTLRAAKNHGAAIEHLRPIRIAGNHHG